MPGPTEPILPRRAAARARRAARAALAILALFTLTACTNLSAVREFAKTSAATADYRQVVSDYVDSPARQLRYQPARFADQLRAVGERRAAQGPLLEAAQLTLVKYMEVLGELASDQRPGTDSEIDGLVSALESAQFIGEGDRQIGKETATAAATIAKVVTRAILDGYRQRQTARIICETDPALQDAIAGLREILDKDLRDSLLNEETAVRKPFQAWTAAATSGNDPDGAPPVARILLDERLEHLRVKRESLDAYLQVLDKIAAGHADLARNVGRLSAPELRDRLKTYSRELRTLYKAVKTLNP